MRQRVPFRSMLLCNELFIVNRFDWRLTLRGERSRLKVDHRSPADLTGDGGAVALDLKSGRGAFADRVGVGSAKDSVNE